MQKVRITKTLIDSWYYSFKRDDGWEDFLSTLNREKKKPTEAMLLGTRYENVLNSVLDGEVIPEDHEWYSVVAEMASELEGAQQQVTLFREVRVGETTFLLHGVLDFLKASRIYDCKFTKRYELGKYFWEKTSQTAMYLSLVPEARDFTYIITDGKWVYRERYPRDIVPDIRDTINQFQKFLRKHDLWELYEQKWRV